MGRLLCTSLVLYVRVVICMKTCWLDRFCCKVRGWVLRRGLAPHQQNKTNIIRKDCCSSCDPLLADMQGTCKTRLAPRKVYNIWFFIKIIKIVGKIVCRPVCSGDCTLGDSPVVERSVTVYGIRSFSYPKDDERRLKWAKDVFCPAKDGRKSVKMTKGDKKNGS